MTISDSPDDVSRPEQPLISLWKTTVLSTSGRFGINPDCLDIEVRLRSGPSLSWPESFGARATVTDTLVEVPNIAGTPAPLLRAILARESLCCLIPADVLEGGALFDLASEYGRQILDETNSQTWSEEWANRSPPSVSPMGIEYDPRSIFEALARLSGRDGLDSLVKHVANLGRHDIEARFEEWIGYLYRFVRDYSWTLNPLEVRVVNALLNEPDLSHETLGSRLDASADWIGKTIQGLKDRGQFREFEYLTFPPLGIRAIHVAAVPDTSTNTCCDDLFRECPFLYSAHKIVMGPGGIFATLCVPDNPQNIKWVQHMVQVGRKNGFRLQEFERLRSVQMHNLNSYESKSQTCEIDWSATQLEAEMVFNGGEAPLYPDLAPSPPDRLSQCDSLDAHLLAEFQKGNATIKGLQKAVRRRTSLVNERMNRFRETGVIRHFWEVHHIGLVNDLVLFCNDVDSSRAVASIAPRLPKSVVDFDKNNHVLLRTQLPAGGSVSLAKALSFMTRPPNSIVIDTRIYGGWLLSNFIQDWNSYTGAWAPHEAGMDDWLGHLEKS